MRVPGRSRLGPRIAAGVSLVTALLDGCSSSGVQRNEDGTLSIECSGGYHDWSQCYERAARACRPGGVEIVGRVSDEGSSGVGTRDWSIEGSEVSRMLVVRCTS